jgi:toxin ParE1/3/4
VGETLRVTLRYTKRATRDIENIHDYIAQYNATAARKTATRIRDSLELLADLPEAGRISEAPGLRRWIIPGQPYFALYTIEPVRQRVLVISVQHTARDQR